MGNEESSSIKHVKELVLTSSHVENLLNGKICEEMKTNTSLTLLCVRGIPAANSKVAHAIAKIIKVNQSVKRFELRSCTFLDFESICVALSQNHSISEVCIYGSTLRLARLIEGLTPCVSHLDLTETSLGDVGANALSMLLQKTKTLTYLDVCQCGLGVERVRVVVGGLKLNDSLRHLNMSLNELGVDGARIVSDGLRNKKSLTKIDMSCNGMKDEGTTCILDALKSCTNVTSINMESNDTAERSIVSLCDVLCACPLKELHWSRNQLTRACALDLSKELAIHKSLTHLNLHLSHLDPYELNALCKSLSMNCHLTHLVLSYNCMTLDGSKAVAELLKCNRTITDFDLAGNSFSVQGALAIGDALIVNRSVQKLSLANSICYTNEFLALADGLKQNQGIKFLNLSSNQRIDDDSHEVVVEIIQSNKCLTSLNLSHAGIVKKAANVVAAMFQANAKLKMLKLDGNPIEWEDTQSIIPLLEMDGSIRELSGVSEAIDALCERNRCMHQLAESSVVMLMCVRKLRKTQLSHAPKEVVAMIAADLLKTKIDISVWKV